MLDELFERHVLMCVGFQSDGAHAPHEFAKGRIARKICAQRQRIDEESDESFKLHAVAIRNRRPDDDIGLLRVAREQRFEGCEQQHEERHAFALR